MKYSPTLKKSHHKFATAENQIEFLESYISETDKVNSFEETLNIQNIARLNPSELEIFQVNVGKMCNQTCKHCHVDAGPDRKEIMTKETMIDCLLFLSNSSVKTVDLTGGAPEMNPNFKWFVREIKKLGKHVIVRSNLTILLTKSHQDDPMFFKDHGIEIVSSLPFYNKSRTDAQRGEGVFEESIKALKILNELGYGKENSGLKLNLVYNPSGAFLPPEQTQLEQQYKKKLFQLYQIEFNSLYAITNMPISRYLDYLVVSDNFESYMSELIEAYNPSSIEHLMCKNTLSIGWDGYVYDCDFNQMLDLNILDSVNNPLHIAQVDTAHLSKRAIRVSEHCFGCTAGAGSSCGGTIAKE